MILLDCWPLTQKIYDLSYHINNQLNNKILLQKGSFFMVPIYTAQSTAVLWAHQPATRLRKNSFGSNDNCFQDFPQPADYQHLPTTASDFKLKSVLKPHFYTMNI